MPKPAITTTNLKLISELMMFEKLAYKKCDHFSQSLGDAKLRSSAKQLAANHKARYDSLLDYLNSHE